MADTAQTYTMHSIRKGVTLKVRLSHMLTVRLWVALQLIKLATFIAEFGYEAEMVDSEDDNASNT